MYYGASAAARVPGGQERLVLKPLSVFASFCCIWLARLIANTRERASPSLLHGADLVYEIKWKWVLKLQGYRGRWFYINCVPQFCPIQQRVGMLCELSTRKENKFQPVTAFRCRFNLFKKFENCLKKNVSKILSPQTFKPVFTTGIKPNQNAYVDRSSEQQKTHGIAASYLVQKFRKNHMPAIHSANHATCWRLISKFRSYTDLHLDWNMYFFQIS